MRCCKNILTTVMTVLLLSVMMSCCQKAPINGDLDGMWQVMQVDPEPAYKPIGQRIYYNFYLHTCNLTVYGDGTFSTSVMAFDGEKMTLKFPDRVSDHHMDRLRQFGINSNPVTFTVEKLTSKSLVLRDGDTTVTMRKF